MTRATPEAAVGRLRSTRSVALAAGVILVVEALLVVGYAAQPRVSVTNPLVFVYPFVWIDVATLAVLTTPLPRATHRRRSIGAVVAVVYFAALAYFGGLWGPGSGMMPVHVTWSLPPGYGPALLYDGQLLRVVLVPYKIVGYVALTFLVYTTVLDAARTAASGLLGLFSCVSCAWPLLGTVVTGIFGSTSALAAVTLGHAYGLSTLVFLSAIGLLWWRPTL